MARAFADAIRAATGTRATSIAVRRRPEHLPTYLLSLFSGDRMAHWDFADIAGKAHVDWLHHCDREDFNANLRRLQTYGIQQLFAEPEPEVTKIDQLLADLARDHFAQHLPPILQRYRSVRPLDCLENLYGDLLGQARERHLREAFKALHKQGLIDDHCKGGDWMECVLTWTDTLRT